VAAVGVEAAAVVGLAVTSPVRFISMLVQQQSPSAAVAPVALLLAAPLVLLELIADCQMLE
jgi:hypothetical protein